MWFFFFIFELTHSHQPSRSWRQRATASKENRAYYYFPLVQTAYTCHPTPHPPASTHHACLLPKDSLLLIMCDHPQACQLHFRFRVFKKKQKKKTGPNSKGARETLVECILMPRPMPCLFYRNWSGVSLKFNGFFLCHVPPLHQVSWNSVRLLLHNVADGQEDKPTESNMQQTQWKTCFSCSISKETLEESSSKALLNMPMAPTHSDITILYALLVFTID